MSDLDALNEIYEITVYPSAVLCHKNQARARNQFGKRARRVQHSDFNRAMRAAKASKRAPITLKRVSLPE
jgi:hypothetical protein